MAAFPQGLALQAWCMTGAYMEVSHHEDGVEWAKSCTKDSVLFPGACFEGKFTAPTAEGCKFSPALCEAQENSVYRKSCFYGWGIQQYRDSTDWVQLCETLPEESDKIACLDGALGFEMLRFFGQSEVLNNWPYEKYCHTYEEGSARHKKCMTMTKFGLYGFEPDFDKAHDAYAEYVLVDKVHDL